MDYIRLTGMNFYGYHGCFDFEKEEGQPFIVDLQMSIDASLAGKSDDLHDSVDYGAVYECVKEVVIGESYHLIERLATVIAETVLANFAVQSIIVTVHKPQAPIQGSFSDVSITIERGRM